jgi:hypothetical protein
MKQLTNVQRATNYLVHVFRLVNSELFDNELEEPSITIQSTVRAYGHVSVSKVWYNGEKATHELNIGAESLNRPIENVVSTLVHEATHLLAMQKGIKDTSNNNMYHNRKFKELAEAHGLIINHDPKYGWTITEPSERIIDFCIENGLEDIQISRMTDYGFGGYGLGGKAGNGGMVPPTPKKPSNSRKYICPKCGAIIRATREVHMICADCNEPMIQVD